MASAWVINLGFGFIAASICASMPVFLGNTNSKSLIIALTLWEGGRASRSVCSWLKLASTISLTRSNSALGAFPLAPVSYLLCK